MRNSPSPGIEPVSPALAGGFLPKGPPGKSRPVSLLCKPNVLSLHNQLKLCFLQATGHLQIVYSKEKPPAVNPLEWHSKEHIKESFFFSFQLRTKGDINDDQEKSDLTCVVSS